MDQVSYRGYARSIGFDPIKAPTEGLARMQERDNRIIRGMEENRRETKQVRDEYGAGLERKLSLEQRDRDQNYAWETKLAENRQKSIGVNAQTIIQSELQRGKNAAATFEGLAKFSTTISNTLTEYRKAQEESDMMAGYMEVASGAITPQRQQSINNRETLLKQAGEAQDQIAEGMQSRGLDPEVVTNLLSGNKARDYGRLKAHMEMITSEFPGYAQSKLDEMGAMTAADRTAAMQGIFGDFLKENGVFGLSADFMAPALMKMRGSYNSFIDAARRSDVVNKSSMMRDDALGNLSRTKSGESLTEAFRALSRSYKEDGVTPVGNAAAKAEIFKELSDTTRYSDADVERILSEAQTDQGSWRDRFGRDYDDLVTSRRKDKEAEFQLNDAEERRAQKAAEDQLLEWVGSKWNGDQETLKAIIDEAKTKGIPTDRLQAYQAKSNEQQNADFWNRQFKEQYEQGTLTASEIDQPGVPVEVRETWRQRAVQLEQQRSDAGISQESIKSELTDALKQNLIGDSTNRSAHYSLRGASDYALRLYNQKFKQYAKTMEPSTAAAKARLDVLTAIEQKKGAFTVIASSQAKVGQTQAFYGAFTPGKHPGAPSNIDIISTSEVLKKVRANSNVINTEVLASPALLRDIDNRISSGKPVSIPLIYSDLSRAVPSMTPVQILNAQLKAAGLKGQIKPGFREQLSQINDPSLRRILDQPLTQDRLNTTINGSGNAPATVRQGNNGYTDVVSLGSASGFKFPQVMAAMWALESGWGKYTSGKNNVFNIKARPGQGTMKNGSYWRDYASPLESAKDFINLMTDPRYAPGIAKAKTPRQAIEAIAAGGYAGGEAAYPTKIIRVMQQMGVNVDQPYTAAPPARNQAFMRPTLAYITSDLGSPGQSHLDVKQWDNPNTAKNEDRMEFADNALDNFVVVKDPEFGTIPIGQLRRKLPGRGDSFAGHVARGSHGIDYPTAMGSQIFLQNGARIVSKAPTAWGTKVVIQLPDGRRFSFLHGKAP
jgi:hypothetical protein